MSLDTIPTRANGAYIDMTWFNIIEQVLTGDVVPRNGSGVVTDIAGNLGTSTYRWISGFFQTLLLGTSSNPVTLAAPVGMTSPYTATLPAAPPGSVQLLSMDASGNVLANTAAGTNIVASASSGTYSNTSSTYSNIVSASITTSGLPVSVSFQPDGSGNNAALACPSTGSYRILRDGTPIAYFAPQMGLSNTGPGILNLLDTGASAGAHTYTLQAQTGSGTISASWIQMLLREW